MSFAAERRWRENAWLWLAKIVSGVLIFAILVIHLVVNHFAAPNGLLSYADVLAYYANPLIPTMEGVFLVFVVSHALLGLRSIALDLEPTPALMRALDAAFVIVGLGASSYGLWLLLTLAQTAARL